MSVQSVGPRLRKDEVREESDSAEWGNYELQTFLARFAGLRDRASSTGEGEQDLFLWDLVES